MAKQRKKRTTPASKKKRAEAPRKGQKRPAPKRATAAKKGASRKTVQKKMRAKRATAKKTRAARPPTAKRPDIPKEPQRLAKNAGVATLDFLEQSWPEELSPEIERAFFTLKNALAAEPVEIAPLASEPAWPPPEEGEAPFPVMELIRRVLSMHDLLFLSRQVTYHIAASAELPAVWAEPQQVGSALSKLVEHMVRRAVRGSQIRIEIGPLAMHSGPGVEIICSGIDRGLDEAMGRSLITTLFEGAAEGSEAWALAEARRVILSQQGQLWADIPKPHHPIYHIVLPASPQAAAPHPAAHRTYKYDIAISNYANVRKRFGIRKSISLVEQIEHYIRALVRYPMDMVMAIGEKGIITTIYETQQGTAESVASRISQRLGREEFRIGKRPVELTFRYNLSLLHPRSPDDRSEREKR